MQVTGAAKKPDAPDVLHVAEIVPTERVVYNADGSVVMQLSTPIMFAGDKHTRVTIPALKGRHMKHAPIKDDPDLGTFVMWASKIVEPLGIVDELDGGDAVELGIELAGALGKSRARGARSSP